MFTRFVRRLVKMRGFVSGHCNTTGQGGGTGGHCG